MVQGTCIKRAVGMLVSMKVPAARGVVGGGARVPAVPASMNVDGRMCCFTINQGPFQQRLDAFDRTHGCKEDALGP